MVKKLYKHELTYYSRSLLPIYAIVLAVAGFSRIIQLFETDNKLYDILFGTSVGTFVIGIISCLILTSVFSITRYYRNLFTAEGYLTFTLPVTPAQHLWTKLLTATLMQVVSFIIIITAACIITAGDVLNELVSAAMYILSHTSAELQNNYWLFAIELIIMGIAAILYQNLLIYACITIGQTVNKNRVLAAVGVYVGYYIVTQVLGTVFVVLSAFIPWGDIGQLIDAHPIFSIHAFAWSAILLNTLLSAVYFIASHQIIRHRLNLE